MSEVTLQQVLQAREDRVAQQNLLLQSHACSLISYTMNIAGPVKTSPLIRRGFDAGLAMLEKRLPPESVRAKLTRSPITGYEAYISVDLPADTLKALCTEIEEATPLGRLLDLDVFAADGTKPARKNERCCLICGKPGRTCASRRLHTVPQLQAATRQILTDHFALQDSTDIAALAVESLVDEASTTPKPGLVDRRNNGSHEDMTLATLYASAHALAPYFAQCAAIGQSTAAQPPREAFRRLRQAGLAAEAAMYQATGGVNTHKGALYTLGILCASVGRLWTPDMPFAATASILAQAAQIGRTAMEDFATATGITAGERLYLQKGLAGIRGEVAAGLPAVADVSLPAYETALAAGFPQNHAGALTLLHLLTTVQDSNLYHRGGADGAAWAAQSARQLLQETATPTPAQLEALDDAFIARQLSPGGCADLLAVTYFLHALRCREHTVPSEEPQQ